MHITKIERTYSRSLEYVKPDNTTLWLKHTATIAGELGEQDDAVEVSNMLHEVAFKQVNDSIIAEKKKLDAVFTQKGDAKEAILKMPRL